MLKQAFLNVAGSGESCLYFRLELWKYRIRINIKKEREYDGGQDKSTAG
jgi:hypothetical protein